MMWSCYCPSLKHTGMVSSATGYLDFISYMAASISSSVFAALVGKIGWHYIVLIWFVLMTLGLTVSLSYKNKT